MGRLRSLFSGKQLDSRRVTNSPWVNSPPPSKEASGPTTRLRSNLLDKELPKRGESTPLSFLQGLWVRSLYLFFLDFIENLSQNSELELRPHYRYTAPWEASGGKRRKSPLRGARSIDMVIHSTISQRPWLMPVWVPRIGVTLRPALPFL